MLPEYLKLTIMVVGIWWEKYIFVVGRKKKTQLGKVGSSKEF